MMWDNVGVTVELGELIESGFELWDFDYPSYYNGEDKTAFEQKVVDHYRFRQIGQETPGRFHHYFKSKIREIMPYYIQLYRFQEKIDAIDDPLESYNLTEEYTEEKTGNGKVSGTTSDSSSSTANRSTDREAAGTLEKSGSEDMTRKFSNTPQGSLSNLDKYLTEATQEAKTTTESGESSDSENITETGATTATGSGTSETISEDSENSTYTLTRRGNIGVQPLGSEIRDIRASFINIDMQIIDELKDLFLMVY